MDVVIRIGVPKDSDLTMRKLIDNRRIIVAAPAYLKRRSKPTKPDSRIFGGVCPRWRKSGIQSSGSQRLRWMKPLIR